MTKAPHPSKQALYNRMSVQNRRAIALDILKPYILLYFRSFRRDPGLGPASPRFGSTSSLGGPEAQKIHFINRNSLIFSSCVSHSLAVPVSSSGGAAQCRLGPGRGS
jgi:hypothetical protein